MHVVLVSIGTDGDLFPHIGLGARLRERGHSVTLVASEDYQALAKENDFSFQALVSAEENRELFEHPDFWNPLKTAPLSARWGVRFLRRQYDLLAKLAGPEMVLVANPGVFAASLVQEKLGVPLATLILQPWMVPSSMAPPLIPNFTLLARAPRPVWELVNHGIALFGDILIGPELNRLRRELGLKPMRRILHKWLSKELVIGMFPDWFGAPQADWPAQVRLVGFPMFDGSDHAGLAPEVLEFCRGGTPPVAFTFGTGMAHSADMFRAALEACEILGSRGIFLTKYREQLPATLPSSVLHCAFAPFQALFPRCRAVVNHGGIGTVAKAMAAGVPQLIRPICFDQIDNGMRVKKLGVGDCLRSEPFSGKQMATALAALMTEETRRNCRQLTMRFGKSDAFVGAAELVEQLHQRRSDSSKQ